MNKTKAVVFTLIILLLPSVLSSIAEGDYNSQNSSNDIKYYDKGYRYNIQGWTYIHIEGDPYERGYQYGYLSYAEILDAIQRWANFGHGIKFMKIFVIKNLPNNYEKLSEQWWNICRSRSKNIFLKQIPKEYIQEMQGIADGVKSRGEKIFGRDIEFEDVLASQFVQEVWYSIKFIQKRFHPLRGFFSGIKDILTGALNNEHPGHCSAFIATGDATSNGGIVIAHSTIFNKLLAQRCNFIVDVKPSEGYRFVMTCPPGSISSQEDYYQNEMGIVITETELPQGPFNLRGKPKGIRSRRAIQYSDSIDEVIDFLNDGNNGLIPNEWLIGDIKTGEIASFEQALFNTVEKRTNSGFFYSCNVPHDNKVKRELFGVIDYLKIIINKIFKIYDAGRSEKFIELKEKYYGEINTEIAKEILATDPICTSTTDGKISDSELIKNMGLLAFMGPPNGESFVPTNEQKEKFKGITDLPASGWVELYPSISEPNLLQTTIDEYNIKKSAIVIWEQEIGEPEIIYPYTNVISQDIVYTSIPPSEIYALDAQKGTTIWNREIGDKVLNHVVSENLIVAGTDKGICAIEKNSRAIKWYQYIGEIYSKPIIDKNLVITSSSNGHLYAFDIDTGIIKWNNELPYPGVVSDVNYNTAFIGAGKVCYCINIKNGETKWEFITDGKITAAPRTYGKNVYFGSWDGNVYALDQSTGKLKWTFETGWGIDTTPIISDNLVYIGSNDNNFYALNRDSGKLVWYYSCKSAIHSSPVVYGEYVFFGSDDGRLYALDKTNGELAWSFAPGYALNNDDANTYYTTPILSDPVVKDSVVYISAKGSIYALDAQTVELSSVGNITEPNDGILTLILYLLLVLLGVAILIRTYLKIKRA